MIKITPARIFTSATEVEAHLNKKGNVSWVRLGELKHKLAEQCVDGRSETGVIGTPGGNMGEFILTLDAAEKTAGIHLRAKEIHALFSYYLKKFGKFYMHTDSHAVEHLEKHFSTPLDLIHPPKTIQSKLIKYLTTPNFIGCGHLKLMLQHAGEYQVRVELIEEAIKAFYKTLWSGSDQVEFVVLNGDHGEGAVATILIPDEELTEDTWIPTLPAKENNFQMFVSHPQAIQYLRTSIAKQLVADKVIYGLGKTKLSKFIHTITNRGNTLTRITLSYLALGLPNYTVTLSK